MTKTPRPSLTSLADHMARKPASALPSAVVESGPASREVTGQPTSPKDGRVQVMARMTPAERKALRRIALEQDTTVQALIEEAIRDLIRRHDGSAAR